MKNNIVVAVFKSESDAVQAFTELRDTPTGEGYFAPEAALIKKNESGALEALEMFGEAPADNTAAGVVIGGLIGLLGGPVGMLLGATIGGLAGQAKIIGNFIDTASAVAVVASKIYEGETAIAALVSEEEPAFDAAFAKYETTIIRYDAADIVDEVARLKNMDVTAIKNAIEGLAGKPDAEAEESGEKADVKLEGWRSATNQALELEG